MASELSQFQNLQEPELRGMITHALKQFAYLDSVSGPNVLYAIARFMIHTEFICDRPTPVRASLEFLRKSGLTAEPPIPKLHERDFIFLIQMFGLIIRAKSGLLEFLPNNRWVDVDGKPGEKVVIDTGIKGREIEMEISDIKKVRKIHMRRIEAALNRLQRNYRDLACARELGRLVKSGMKIGDAKDVLRNDHYVKDHEYVRVRDCALRMGFLPKKERRASTRVTLDEDVLVYVEGARSKPEMRLRTPSQIINSMIRDLHFMLHKKPLPGAPKDRD